MAKPDEVEGNAGDEDMAQNKVQAITRTSIAGSSLTSSFQAINASGLGAACFKIAIYNTTNGQVDISYDGSTVNDLVLGNSSIEISSQTNAQPTANVALFAKGQVVYVKGSSGTGSVYLVGYYVAPNSQ